MHKQLTSFFTAILITGTITLSHAGSPRDYKYLTKNYQVEAKKYYQHDFRQDLRARSRLSLECRMDSDCESGEVCAAGQCMEKPKPKPVFEAAPVKETVDAVPYTGPNQSPSFIDNEGYLYVFARGADNLLYSWHWHSEFGWGPHGIEYQIGTQELASDPVAVYNQSNGNIEVFARGVNDELLHWYWDASGEGWGEDGHEGVIGTYELSSAPTAVYNERNGNIEVFAKGEYGHLFHWHWKSNGGGWGANGHEAIIGTETMVSAPTAFFKPKVYFASLDDSFYVAYKSNSIEVFGQNDQNQLFHWYWQDMLGGWNDNGNQSFITHDNASTASGLYNASLGQIDIFSRSETNQLKHTAWSAHTGWGTELLGNYQLKNHPTSLYNVANGNMEIFARAANNKLLHFHWDSQYGWGYQANQAIASDQLLANAPTAIYNPINHSVEIFAQGQSGHLLRFNRDAHTSEWSNKAQAVVLSKALIQGVPSAVFVGSLHFKGLKGGMGGGNFITHCPEGEVAVGLKGKAGADIDSVGLICSKPFSEELTTNLPLHGGNGGGYFELVCPQITAEGQGVLIGLDSLYEKTDGKVLKNFTVNCGFINPSDDIDGVSFSEETEQLVTVGGNDSDKGSIFDGNYYGYPSWHTDKSVVTGLVGRSGSRVDSLDLIYKKVDLFD